MVIIGMDLSGPGNSSDTAVVAFKSSGKGLARIRHLTRADDGDILDFMTSLELDSPPVVGIDAPLSYNVGGGDRSGDAALRKRVIAAGMKAGSIMPPTLTRMAYLTLRGISIARLLSATFDNIKIAEIHPGGTMALGGAPIEDVRHFKKEENARMALLNWMVTQGLEHADDIRDPSDHYVAACAAALGAWKWHLGLSEWLYRSEQPFHPFDYAC
ncbi:MAG: DUF429 domain-containing protein [Desulfobacter sp.]